MKILVTGATGLIGCHAATQLLDAGHSVRVLVRDPSKLDRVLAPFGRTATDVEISEGGINDSRSVESGLEGCQGLLHCAGVFSPRRSDAELLERTNVDGTRVVLEAGADLGIEHIIYLSSILSLFPPQGEVMRASDPVVRPGSMYAATKARAERVARSIQERAPVTILYPAAVQGPDDPTFSIGPELVASALRDGKVLVTEGGLAYTDARDLAALIVALFGGAKASGRIMGPSFFVPHSDYHAILEKLTGRTLARQELPGWLMRWMGRAGDVVQRLGRDVQLTYEAAEVLTRSVPSEDSEARELLGRPLISAEASFRDLISWMVAAGHLEREFAGKSG